ncbi:MAG: pseudouridine synthase [Anaerolineae bacterium]
MGHQIPEANRAERLQKVLARAGVASRRASEALIAEGRVTVNGQRVTQPGLKVDPRRDAIAVDGQPLAVRAEEAVYVMLNKPRQVLSAASDGRGRRTVLDLVRLPQRVYPVGRLDLDSEGLLLLTNDGPLTERLTHPRYAHEKEYEVLVGGRLSDRALRRWQRGGFEVEGRSVSPMRVQRLRVEGDGTWLKITLTEGRKRQIRVVAGQLGHSVRRLVRTRFGPLKLGRLKSGAWRHLTPAEVNQLRRLVKR